MGRKKLLLTIAISGFLLVVLSVGVIEFTSQPRFCYNCHEMGALYDAWEQGKHKEVACLKCHAEPGVAGLVRTKAKGLREVYVHFTNPQIEPEEKADTWEFSQRCLACHDNIQAPGGPHNEKHFEMEFVCVKCHSGVAHDPGYESPSAEVCAQCHSK